MKRMLMLWYAFAMAIGVIASDNKYESSMSSAIEKLYSAETKEDYQKVASIFERISQAESDKWLPAYYASLSYIWMTHKLSGAEEIDKVLDEAQKNLDHCKGTVPENDEVLALQGYIYMMRVTVDPPSRGAQYSPMSMGSFQKALSINKDNPRALLLMGQMKYGTDQFFGNDVTDACQMIQQAVQMFDNEKPDGKLAPAWGKNMANYLVQNCQ